MITSKITSLEHINTYHWGHKRYARCRPCRYYRISYHQQRLHNLYIPKNDINRVLVLE